MTPGCPRWWLTPRARDPNSLILRNVQLLHNAGLPWVHIVIANLKRFLLGTFHGAVRPHRLQEYIDEFVYRFNRRYWEEQIPNRLLAHCVGASGPALCGTGA